MYQLRGIELKRFIKSIKRPEINLYLLLENIQYATNVASIFRTAEAFSVRKLFLTGISITPPFGKDLSKASRQKEKKVQWEYAQNAGDIISKFRNEDTELVGLEITDKSIPISTYIPKQNILLVLGNEGYGITQKTLDKLDKTIYIPMYGQGASINVGVAAGVALNNIINNYEKHK